MPPPFSRPVIRQHDLARLRDFDSLDLEAGDCFVPRFALAAIRFGELYGWPVPLTGVLDELEMWAPRKESHFTIHYRGHLSPKFMLRRLFRQVAIRQRESPGMQFAGAVMQHLVGAKLECALGAGAIGHNSFSTSDAQSNRVGDFKVGDAAIHVTTAPGDAVIARCKANLEQGLRPLIVTVARGTAGAELAAENAGIGDRVDVFEVEQFVALNLYEMSRFAHAGRRVELGRLIAAYNAVIDAHETDPSLRIELADG